MNEAKWYVVHTYSGYEKKVMQSLEAIMANREDMKDLIVDVKIPYQTVEEIKDGKVIEKEEMIFPAYVFVKMVLTDETWYIVRNTRGVTGFVGANAQKPNPLSDKEVERMGVETKVITINFAIGDAVEVTRGSFEGFPGIVTGIDTENKKVTLSVNMFGGETPLELDITDVKKV